MHIPDKYRDRYDRLALSHPWMREMRDETETIGDLIEKRKEEIEERNHLIAKARNSFKSLAESNYDYAKFRKACRRATEIMDAEMGRMGIASDGRATEALDEPTNGIDGGTNGIADGPPLVDGLPDGDAVEILRKWANFWGASHSTHTQCDSNWEKTTMRTLADMIERDYVKLSEYERAIRDAQELYLQVERERDDWKIKCETYEFAYKQADAQRKRYGDQIDELFAERDELSDKIGEITDEASELMKKQPYTFNVHDAPGSLRTVGRYIDELKSRHCPHYHAEKHYCDVHEMRINALIAERDEWKAKAEACNPCGWWNASLQYCERNDDSAPDSDVSANDVDANELCKQCEWPSLAAQPDQEAYDRIAELTAKVDEQSELIAARGKMIETLEHMLAEKKAKYREVREKMLDYQRNVKAERDEYRELYEAAMSTDYAQVERERDEMSRQIDQIRSIIDETSNDGLADE